jgi:hypothetical protein
VGVNAGDSSGTRVHDQGASLLPHNVSNSSAGQETTTSKALIAKAYGDHPGFDGNDTNRQGNVTNDQGVSMTIANHCESVADTPAMNDNRCNNSLPTSDTLIVPSSDVESEMDRDTKGIRTSQQFGQHSTGSGGKKKKSKSRSVSPNTGEMNRHSTEVQIGEQNFSKTTPSLTNESGAMNGLPPVADVQNGGFKQPSRTDAIEPPPSISDAPSTVLLNPLGLTFPSPSLPTTPTSKAFDDLLNSREFSLALPSFNGNQPVSAVSHYWTTTFHQPSSSIPELEREIESARKEAALLNIKLQAAIRKNQAFATTGW